MIVTYRISTNSGVETRESSLHSFLKEFHFLFSAKLVPPYDVIKDLCNSDPLVWGADSRVEWKVFVVSESDYKVAMNELITLLSLTYCEVPANINTAYRWSLWQYEVSHKVPYEELKNLSDEELASQERLNRALESGDKIAIETCHLDFIDASDNVSDFLNSYLAPK